MPISFERARQLFDYNDKTGVLTWRRTGKPVGSPQNEYLATRIGGAKYYVHRLVWLLKTGAFPAGHIDHADMDRRNNKFSNLRDASRSDNLRNTTAYKNNQTGFKGASKRRGRYRAQISISGRSKYLGSFLTPDEASAAYLQAALQISPEFARV